MTANPKLLQVVAYTLKPTFQTAPIDIYGLMFPRTWHFEFCRLQAERDGRLIGGMFPLRSLNHVLRALVPTFATVPLDYTVGTKGEEPGDRLWLLAEQPIAPLAIWLVVQAWLELYYHGCPSLSSVKGIVLPQDLRWEPLSFIPNTTGSGRPDTFHYRALPSLLAQRLVSAQLRLPVHGTPTGLVWTPVDGGGAELISWPPEFIREQGELAGAFSYVAKLTLQSFMHTSESRVHIHFSMRRWRTAPLYVENKIRLPQGNTSAYLLVDQGWLELPATRALAKVNMQVSYDNAGQRQLLWQDLVAPIAQRLNVAFPNITTLATDPGAWLDGAHSPQVGVIERNVRFHRLGKGFALADVERLATLFTNALTPYLDKVPALEQAPVYRRATGVAHPLMEDLRDVPAPERLTALVESVGPQVGIEVHYQTERGRDYLIDSMRQWLQGEKPVAVQDLITPPIQAALIEAEATPKRSSRPRPTKALPPPPSPPSIRDAITIPLPGSGVLTITSYPLGEIGAPLAAPKHAQDTLAKRTAARAQLIAQHIGKVTVPTLALIELPHYRDPQQPQLRHEVGRRRDPKLALRLGMAATGRVTQFMTPASPTENDRQVRYKADGAARDGLRNLGFLPAPIGFTFANGAPQLPPNLLVAAVWIVRLTTRTAGRGIHLPVVVLCHTGQRRIMAWLPDKTGTIRSYAQALCDITKVTPEEVKGDFSTRERALQRLRHFLLRDLPLAGGDNAVILAVAQNARATWSALANTTAQTDTIGFTGKDAQLVTSLPGRLRLIRLRTNQRGETPEWYRSGVKSSHGLWRDPFVLRQMYNSADKPASMRLILATTDERPDQHHAIASLLEIAPLAVQPEDILDAKGTTIWPYAVDQWRQMSYLTEEMTLLPLPLALAAKMDEYARVIGPGVFQDEWDIDEEEDEPESEESIIQGTLFS